MQQRFNPTLSWDGVAMISACIMCTLWFGSLSDTVKQHSTELQHHEQLIQSLSEGQKLISQNIAVLQTIVNERAYTSHEPTHH